MKIKENGLAVLERRYFMRDSEGKPIETPEGLLKRVALAVAKGDLHYNPQSDVETTARVFYDMMCNLEFLPNSPTLMNAGGPLGQLSACFVLPIGDSMEEIFEAVKQAALIHKSGGGTGFSFSRLRPKGATVCTTGGVASGPVSFMRVFNMATEAVKQGGTRRGANMGILRVDHPDILEFVDCKLDHQEFTNFNISVGITNAFMEALEKGDSYSLLDPTTKEAIGRLDATMVFDRIVENAWKNGEPGMVFLDRLNENNPVPSMGEVESTNPCGEQPLLPYESCNLGSIHLVEMLTQQEGNYLVDWNKLRRTVINAVHFLDNVITINRYPLQEIEKTTKCSRKIGLGVMGFADMLLLLGIPYNSKEALTLAEEVMAFISGTSHEATQELARVRGAFPAFSESIFQGTAPRRNATTTTIAPTGTLSILAGCSSGVEPVFAYAYIRNIMDETHFTEVNPILERILKEKGLYQPALMERIAQEGTLAHIQELPEEIRRVFVCAHDITPTDHVQMQAAFQKYTDNAVSKTVNFPRDATMEQVREAFLQAYALGCKGITIYRDGSRDSQVLNIGSVSHSQEDSSHAPLLPRPRPAVMRGITERVQIGCGNLYVTVNYDDGGICEVFTSTGKAGGCPSQSEATARLASIALRSGVQQEEIIRQLRGIRCPSTIRQSSIQCTSCPDAIARVMQRVAAMLPTEESDSLSPLQPRSKQPTSSVAQESPVEDPCPECGTPLGHESGCNICRNCGYSKCK